MIAPSLTDLERAVTQRSRSFFARDVEDRVRDLKSVAEGRRVLVVGGGGSIGAVTTRALLALRPASVDVVDISENYLVELVREVRSASGDTSAIDLQTHVLDYGAPLMRRFLAAQEAFDVVLNFAAVKHVRSEKDVCSLLHMLDVNVVKHARFKASLAEFGHRGRYFAVSTDKAANPSSLMGASKRMMEDVAFDVGGDATSVTSARFANVAFSNGSLLQGFLARLAKHQPLAVPVDTRRYFISHEEAADICLLTALVAPPANVLVPALNPQEHLLSLQDVAVRVLEACGYAAWFTSDELTAKAAMRDTDVRRRWPVLLTPLDTTGEKPYEEFLGDGERASPIGFETLLGIPHRRNASADVSALVAELARYVEDADADVDKTRLTALLSAWVPGMRHVETGRHLDARM